MEHRPVIRHEMSPICVKGDQRAGQLVFRANTYLKPLFLFVEQAKCKTYIYLANCKKHVCVTINQLI